MTVLDTVSNLMYHEGGGLQDVRVFPLTDCNMSEKKFAQALAALFSKPEQTAPKTMTCNDPPPLQLLSKAHDKHRGNAYLPPKGDSGRAVHPAFSCHVDPHATPPRK